MKNEFTDCRGKTTSQTIESLEQFWYDEMRFCGCHAPAQVLKGLRDILQKLHSSLESAGTSEPYLPDDDDATAWFMLYVLDAHGLTEHGGSIAGAWLTATGEELLNLLNAVTDWENYDLPKYEWVV